MKGKESPHPVIYAIARFHENLLNFFFEWIVLFIIATVAVAYSGYTNFSGIVADIFLLPVLLILVQVATIRGGIGSSLGYALDLARRTGTPPRKSKNRRPPPLYTFLLHVKAFRRWLDYETGGYAEDLMLSAIRGQEDEKTVRPSSFSELAHAIEFGLVLEATSRSTGEERIPFREYAQLLQERVFKSATAAQATAQFWAGRYEPLPQRTKLLAAEHRPQSKTETFKQNIEVWKLVLTFILSIVALFVGSRILFP